MYLCEIATGYMGSAFERCYVWADTIERAEELFKETHPNREKVELTVILHVDDPEFITELNDEAFGERISKSSKN